MTTRVHHIAPVCEFGSCDILGTTREDGYLFCAKHLTEHRLMFPKADKKRPAPPPLKPREPPQPCGTPAAYNRHLKHHEVPCDPCKEAARIKNRARKRTIKAKADAWDAAQEGAA